jgi:hypothetical protein
MTGEEEEEYSLIEINGLIAVRRNTPLLKYAIKAGSKVDERRESIRTTGG